MIDLIRQHHSEIELLCRKYRVTRLELFGSAARGDFDRTSSDLDFLVEFEALGWKGSSDRYFGLLHGLEDLFQKRVDLVELSAAKNPHFIEVASRHRELLYAA
jgi:predicted nucleotidyltransferase